MADAGRLASCAMRSSRRASLHRLALAGLASPWFATWSWAAGEIVVAHIGPFSGPLAINGQANFVGAQAAFGAANAQGGVSGRRIRLLREDDTYKAAETVRLLRLVAERDKPVAFINLLGSANAAAVLESKVLDEIAIPVIGLTPGADAFREPGNRHLFHVQAGDSVQLRAVVQHLATVGLRRIAVVYQDNPFGKAGLAKIEQFAAESKLVVAGKATMALGAEDGKEAARQLRSAEAQTYLMVLAPNSGAAFVRDVRAENPGVPIYGLSYVAADVIVAKAGVEHAAGVALAQVTPNPGAGGTRITREYRSDMQQFAPKDAKLSPLSLIGYLAARITLEGLRRAKSINPESLETALRALHHDFGGYLVDFTDGRNVGSKKVDIGVIDRAGVLRY